MASGRGRLRRRSGLSAAGMMRRSRRSWRVRICARAFWGGWVISSSRRGGRSGGVGGTGRGGVVRCFAPGGLGGGALGGVAPRGGGCFAVFRARGCCGGGGGDFWGGKNKKTPATRMRQ